MERSANCCSKVIELPLICWSRMYRMVSSWPTSKSMGVWVGVAVIVLLGVGVLVGDGWGEAVAVPVGGTVTVGEGGVAEGRDVAATSGAGLVGPEGSPRPLCTVLQPAMDNRRMSRRGTRCLFKNI